MSDYDRNDSEIAASTVGLAGFDKTRKPLIPAKIANPVTPSIISMSNSALSANVESTRKEHNVSIDDLSSFIGTPMKDDTDNHHSRMLHHAKEINSTVLTQTKKAMLLHIMISGTLLATKFHALFLCEFHDQDDDTVKNSSSAALNHDSENNATVHNAK